MSPSDEAMMASITIGQETTTEALLAHGANVNAFLKSKNDPTLAGPTALMQAVLIQSEPHVRLLVHSGSALNTRNASGWCALSIAIRSGNDAITEILMRGGAKPDGPFDPSARHPPPGVRACVTPLECAILKNSEYWVNRLLAAHVNVFLPYILSDRSSFMLATLQGNANILQALLSEASLYDIGPEHNLLQIAARDGNSHICKLLIESWHTDVRLGDANGKTALMYAVSENNYETMQVLLAAGACAQDMDHFGNNALFFALRAPVLKDDSPFYEELTSRTNPIKMIEAMALVAKPTKHDDRLVVFRMLKGKSNIPCLDTFRHALIASLRLKICCGREGCISKVRVKCGTCGKGYCMQQHATDDWFGDKDGTQMRHCFECIPDKALVGKNVYSFYKHAMDCLK